MPFENVRSGKFQIADVCIGCGDMNLHTTHPLFEGGFCKECKVRVNSLPACINSPSISLSCLFLQESFIACSYRFDEDGTQMYCCICSGGVEVYLCDAESCSK